MNGKIAVSVLTAFIISSGAVIVGVAGSGYAINKTTALLACVFGAMGAAKDWRSQLALPPLTVADVPVNAIVDPSKRLDNTPPK